MTYHAFYTPYDDPDTEDVDESEDWKFIKTIRWNGKGTRYDIPQFSVSGNLSGKGNNGRVVLLKVDLITPGGNPDNDPVNKPIDGGDGTGTVPDGANEFTFSTASNGVLTIQFKAEVGGGSSILNAIKDRVSFTIEDVGQAPTWDAANPGGKASVSGNYLVAAATFTGLPADNSDFGKKKVELLFNGSVVEESEIEVFFPRDAKNHPEDGSGTTPNWFYYWGEVSARNNLVYGGAAPFPSILGEVSGMLNWSWTTAPDKVNVHLYDGVEKKYKPYNVGEEVSGIDAFMSTVRHEEEHIDQISRADGLVSASNGTEWQHGWSWNKNPHNHWELGTDGEPGKAAVDDDSDGFVDNHVGNGAGELGGVAGDDVNLSRYYPSGYNNWPASWPLPNPHLTSSPIESEAINAANDDVDEDQYARSDWANPGKNHETEDKWDDL